MNAPHRFTRPRRFVRNPPPELLRQVERDDWAFNQRFHAESRIHWGEVVVMLLVAFAIGAMLAVML